MKSGVLAVIGMFGVLAKSLSDMSAVTTISADSSSEMC